jgi:uncharacterized membrane protein
MAKFMEKVKKIAKYTTNILTFLGLMIQVLDPIWGIPFADKIIATIVGVTGVIGGYLIGDKTVTKLKTK